MLAEGAATAEAEEPQQADEEIDIDALLAEGAATAEAEAEEPQLADEEIDIDALLAEGAPAAEAEAEEPQLADEEIDIDALLAKGAPAAKAEAEEPQLADEEIDIDAILAESTSAPEPASETKPDTERTAEEEDLDYLAAELDAAAEKGDFDALDASDEALLGLDSLLDASAEAEPLSEAEVSEEALDINHLLAGEEPKKPAAQAMTADELEQEFDLDNIADELLAENDAETTLDLDTELESVLDSEADVSPEELAGQLTGIELDQADPEATVSAEPEDYVDIDSLLAEADSADGASDSDSLLPGEIEGPSDLDEEDEVAAKLDLARAYIEIGDTDVARELLQEIIRDDSGSHTLEAQDLLDRMA